MKSKWGDEAKPPRARSERAIDEDASGGEEGEAAAEERPGEERAPNDAPSEENRSEGAESAIRTALIAGPVLAAIGIAWTVVAPSYASQAAVLVGWITLVWGTHRFGRLGAS